MHYITRMTRINNVNEYEYLNGKNGCWVEDFNEAQGYKTYTGAKNKFLKVAKVYQEYYAHMGSNVWTEKKLNRFLSISFEGKTQSVKHLNVDFAH